MRIIKNQPILEQHTDNYIINELSNVATAIQTQCILVDYYQVDLDRTQTLKGLRNIEDYIGPTSTVVYKHIEKLPIMGIDNLVSEAQFDEELGYEETFSQSGAIFPNTIVPRPYDCFTIPNSPVKALYVITDVTPVTVRSNPFTGIQFRLYTRNPEIIDQLIQQVKGEFITTVTAIGSDRSLVIEKESFFKISDHVESYITLADLYESLFYDRTKSGFVFDGLPGLDGGGCLGYMTKDDAEGKFPEEVITDPDHPLYPVVSKVKHLKNGDPINDEGDHLYIVDGEPIVVSDHLPYWFVRNHVDHYGDANNYPGAGISDECSCCTCYNQNCPNKGGPGCPEVQSYYADESNIENVVRQAFVDVTLWKLMFEEGIVIYDDVVTYSNNNYIKTIPRIYTDSPDLYVDMHHYKRSVLYRIAMREKNPFQFVHPHSYEVDPRIAKFQGKHIYYLEYYDSTRDCNLNCGFYNIWDDEFQYRILHNCPYPSEPEQIPISYEGCSCTVKKLYPFNTSLRNAIIAGYNKCPIDWNSLEINSSVNIENYILIPLVLHYYKEYIETLQE